jgi:hypothetical protein
MRVLKAFVFIVFVVLFVACSGKSDLQSKKFVNYFTIDFFKLIYVKQKDQKKFLKNMRKIQNMN